MAYLERILKIGAEVKPDSLNHVSVRHENGESQIMNAIIEFSETGEIIQIFLCGKSSDDNQSMFKNL